jgi:hypothetical protein|tara:strand:- start:8203 stop:8646 length:444 start_codon:yes stop_codon:yes gene_type:complete
MGDGDGGGWTPIVRRSRQIPFGYKQDPDDDRVLLPIHEHLDRLVEAKAYLKTCSYREVSAWLSVKTGRPITFQALHKLITKEKKRTNVAKLFRYYATKAKEYAETERRIQEGIIYVPDSKKPNPLDTSWADDILIAPVEGGGGGGGG